MSKQATLTLTHRQKFWDETNKMPLEKPVDYFVVEKVTDSVTYLPGQELHINEIHGLCANTGWKVIIQKPKG